MNTVLEQVVLLLSTRLRQGYVCLSSAQEAESKKEAGDAEATAAPKLCGSVLFFAGDYSVYST